MLAACSSRAAAPVPHHAATEPPTIAIEDIRGLELPRRDPAGRDCRLSSVLREHFAGQRFRPCGALAPGADVRAAVDCAESALADNEPFVVEQYVDDLPRDEGESNPAVGFVGALEGSELVVYRLDYSDGSCHHAGCVGEPRTTIARCTRFVRAPRFAECRHDVGRCFACDRGGAPVTRCGAR